METGWERLRQLLIYSLYRRYWKLPSLGCGAANVFPIKTCVYIFCIFYCVIARFIAGLLCFLWGRKYGREALICHMIGAKNRTLLKFDQRGHGSRTEQSALGHMGFLVIRYKWEVLDWARTSRLTLNVIQLWTSVEVRCTGTPNTLYIWPYVTYWTTTRHMEGMRSGLWNEHQL